MKRTFTAQLSPGPRRPTAAHFHHCTKCTEVMICIRSCRVPGRPRTRRCSQCVEDTMHVLSWSPDPDLDSWVNQQRALRGLPPIEGA